MGSCAPSGDVSSRRLQLQSVRDGRDLQAERPPASSMIQGLCSLPRQTVVVISHGVSTRRGGSLLDRQRAVAVTVGRCVAPHARARRMLCLALRNARNWSCFSNDRAWHMTKTVLQTAMRLHGYLSNTGWSGRWPDFSQRPARVWQGKLIFRPALSVTPQRRSLPRRASTSEMKPTCRFVSNWPDNPSRLREPLQCASCFLVGGADRASSCDPAS